MYVCTLFINVAYAMVGYSGVLLCIPCQGMKEALANPRLILKTTGLLCADICSF